MDIKIKDNHGRYWQLSTIQIDFNLPERFSMEYIDENGETRTFTEEVFTNVDGEYSYTLTPAQGNVTEVVANEILLIGK